MAAMGDRASVNTVAMQTLSLIYPTVLDVGCFSHTLDHVGGKFNVPVVDDFTKLWVALFSRSPKARLAWNTFCGRAVPTYSETRWWSRWEVMKQILEGFPDVEQFINTSCDLAPATIGKLKQTLNNPVKRLQLKHELAVVIDGGEAFVKATYKLEGDGPLALSAFEEIRKLYTVIVAPHFPNTTAVARQASNGNQSNEQQLVASASLSVQPGFEYFKSKFDNELSPIVKVFKATRMLSPIKMSEMKVDTSTVDELSALPSLNNPTVLANIKSDLPAYVSAVEDIDKDIDVLQWWRKQEKDLPHWSMALNTALLVQPSSAASERVFSLLQNCFKSQQCSSLEDDIESSIMLQYKNRSNHGIFFYSLSIVVA